MRIRDAQAGASSPQHEQRSMAFAQHLKAQGNTLFMAGKYTDAAAKYQFARFSISGPYIAGQLHWLVGCQSG